VLRQDLLGQGQDQGEGMLGDGFLIGRSDRHRNAVIGGRGHVHSIGADAVRAMILKLRRASRQAARVGAEPARERQFPSGR